MADVIAMPSMARLRELEAECVRLKDELRAASLKATKADAVYAVTRMQLNDILSTIVSWRRDLDQVEENVRTLKLQLPEA